MTNFPGCLYWGEVRRSVCAYLSVLHAKANTNRKDLTVRLIASMKSNLPVILNNTRRNRCTGSVRVKLIPRRLGGIWIHLPKFAHSRYLNENNFNLSRVEWKAWKSSLWKLNVYIELSGTFELNAGTGSVESRISTAKAFIIGPAVDIILVTMSDLLI